MTISRKQETEETVLNHKYIDFKYFMNLYKKCTAKPYSFLVIDTTLHSHNSSRFRKNLLETI